MKALVAENVGKTYANGVEALKNVSFEIEEGDFFSLLGPNGAGKTTFIGIISGLVNKSAGRIRVFGRDIDQSPDDAKSLIGVVPQEFNFNIFEKTMDIVVSQAGYYGVPRSVAIPETEKILQQLGLWEKRNTKSMQLSGGMKRRLMIARALAHKPKLLILDEPTAGVDIELRRGMWEFLKKITAEGVTIILTTHYLEEAEQLSKHVAIIDHGVVVKQGSVKELLSGLESQTFVFDTKESVSSNLEKEFRAYSFKKIDHNTFEVSVNDQHPLNALLIELQNQGVVIESFRNKINRLEEVFVDIVNSSRNKKND
ncbi:MAG: ABC transporter ATP-binding protein [Anaplasmataceae bacterium]|nr:ABC transporter ATP-binding protein [Anaplasmataceae bacterium]